MFLKYKKSNSLEKREEEEEEKKTPGSFCGSFVWRWLHLCGYIAWLLSCLSDDDALEDVPVKMTAKWMARKTTQGVIRNSFFSYTVSSEMWVCSEKVLQ